jgi:hypothetical protein
VLDPDALSGEPVRPTRNVAGGVDILLAGLEEFVHHHTAVDGKARLGCECHRGTDTDTDNNKVGIKSFGHWLLTLCTSHEPHEGAPGSGHNTFVAPIASPDAVPPYAPNENSFAGGTSAASLAPRALPVFSRSSRNGLMMSIGIGKTTMEFCSAPISVSVCR